VSHTPVGRGHERLEWRGCSLSACLLRPIEDVEACLVERVLSRRFRAARPRAARTIDAKLHGLAASTPRASALRLSLVRHAMAAIRHDARSVLGRIQAPTLVLAGDEDGMLGVEAPQELARGISNATFVIIREAGHDITLEQPSVTAARVALFFAD
jgi:pimeloyl-ACP methyl ester carboxylesterase